MTLRAKGARKRRGSSPRRKEEGTVKVCPEVGRERRLIYGHLGAPTRAAVNRERRAPVAVLDRDGEAVGPSFTIVASQDGVATLLRTLDARGATAAPTLIGLEASGHLWENLEAALIGAGYRVLVLNPLHESGDRAAPPRLSPVGSRIARHSLYLAAVNAVRRSGEWRTIYLRKKAQGKTAKQALVVVAVKLLHAVYAMLKHRQPYNPSRLLVAPATIGS
jgi:hypothetical protein